MGVIRSGLIAVFVAMLSSLSQPSVAASLSEGNSLELRQFRIDHARLPGPSSIRQSILAWQVTQGTWNGQILDGLSLVFVQSTSDDGRSSSFTNCYISHEASAAQREALRAAFISTQSGYAMQNMRLEPAVITMEQDGGMVILHVGLVG